jgi:hypothetical protein
LVESDGGHVNSPVIELWVGPKPPVLVRA